ncbi:MAG: DUF1761 domain-containing protein [Acidobacteria bacterium]|nr:DUF1761 domain-containing protein [Acidobacteriota bacterium]
MPDVSLLATLVATLAGFGLGVLWYGPLFGRTVASASALRATAGEPSHPRTVAQHGTVFVLGLVASYVFGLFLGPHPGRAFSIVAGAAAGICWVATSVATTYLFEGKRPALVIIDGGYHAVRFALIGLVFGLLG